MNNASEGDSFIADNVFGGNPNIVENAVETILLLRTMPLESIPCGRIMPNMRSDFRTMS